MHQTYICWLGGTAIQSQQGGTPGYPPSGWGTPCQEEWGYPCQEEWGIPARKDGGTPPSGRMGYPFPWTDRHLWKHNLLRTRSVIITLNNCIECEYFTIILFAADWIHDIVIDSQNNGRHTSLPLVPEGNKKYMYLCTYSFGFKPHNSYTKCRVCFDTNNLILQNLLHLFINLSDKFRILLNKIEGTVIIF